MPDAVQPSESVLRLKKAVLAPRLGGYVPQLSYKSHKKKAPQP